MAENHTKFEGDALSRMIQVQALLYDIRLAWTGRGDGDLAMLIKAHAAKERLTRHLWTSLRELLQMPEMRSLPDALQAQITSTILRAQALTDLEMSTIEARKSAPAMIKAPA